MDTFISEEITTYFPDDGCKLHVLALDITESQHADIQKLRPNVFELVPYLRAQKILHVLAHPLYAINDRLSAAHFEQMLLLFQNLELNGARNRRENDVIAHLAAALTPEDIDLLAEKHRITPCGERPWEKRLFAGSDDHSSLNIARAFTEVRRAGKGRLTPENIAAAELVTHIHPASPQTMAHNLYGIAYQFYRDRFDLGRFAGKDVMVRFLDHSLRSEEYQEPGFLSKLVLLWSRRRGRKLKTPAADSLLPLIQAETRRLLQKDIGLASGLEGGGKTINGQDIRWFNFVRQVSDRVTLHFSDHIVDHLSGANVFNIFHTIGAAGGLYALLANVVLEAQASGLPVIVTDQGGPAENVLPGETGRIVKGGDIEELLQAMRFFVHHPERLRRMGRAARAYMELRSFDAAFLQTWDMYASVEADFKPSRPWPEMAANLS